MLDLSYTVRTVSIWDTLYSAFILTIKQRLQCLGVNVTGRGSVCILDANVTVLKLGWVGEWGYSIRLKVHD